MELKIDSHCLDVIKSGKKVAGTLCFIDKDNAEFKMWPRGNKVGKYSIYKTEHGKATISSAGVTLKMIFDAHEIKDKYNLNATLLNETINTTEFLTAQL